MADFQRAAANSTDNDTFYNAVLCGCCQTGPLTNKAVVLHCGHSICPECYESLRAESRNRRMEPITCPFCRHRIDFDKKAENAAFNTLYDYCCKRLTIKRMALQKMKKDLMSEKAKNQQLQEEHASEVEQLQADIEALEVKIQNVENDYEEAIRMEVDDALQAIAEKLSKFQRDTTMKELGNALRSEATATAEKLSNFQRGATVKELGNALRSEAMATAEKLSSNFQRGATVKELGNALRSEAMATAVKLLNFQRDRIGEKLANALRSKARA